MKKILIILITIPLIFGSCEKEDNSPDSNNNGNNNPIVNTTTGYLCDDDGDVYKTTNSGVTWTEQGEQWTGGDVVGLSFP